MQFLWQALVATAFFSLQAATATLDLPLNTTGLAGLYSHGSEVQCKPAAALRKLMKPFHCLHAILNLPQDTETGLFRSGNSPVDGFQLPKTSVRGTCSATVFLADPQSKIKSSWLLIKQSADLAAVYCSDSRYPLGEFGNIEVSIGEKNGITIQLNSVMQSNGDEE